MEKRLKLIRKAVEKINRQNMRNAKADALKMMKQSGMFDEEKEIEERGPGLWANIHKRSKSGKRMRKKCRKGYFVSVHEEDDTVYFADDDAFPMVNLWRVVPASKKIWETNLPYSGSAPPMAYNYKGCDIIVFTSTGGRFVGYQKNGDSTVAYKLNNCNFN